MKTFLTLTALFEGITGLILLTIPSVFLSFLLGTALNEPGGILARLTGVALLSISIACWSCRNEAHHASGIGKALLFYNIAAGSLLIYSFKAGFSGIGLWPAVIQHFVFGIWCIQLLKKQPGHVTP